MTSTERKIRAMIRENTGSHLLDSGSAYGYIYQTPIPAHAITVSTRRSVGILEVECSISLFHLLVDNLRETDTSRRFDRQLARMIRSPGHADCSYLNCMQEFADTIDDKSTYTVSESAFNSYNEETDLDQHFQGILFSYDHESYIAIQSHNGCDIRGGYSKPRVFQVEEGGVGLVDSWRVTFYCPGCACDIDVVTNTEIEIEGEEGQPPTITCQDCGSIVTWLAGTLH